MKIGCFCMVKDEAMMIPAFLDQIREFFDISIFLDHSSTDCTPKIIRDSILNAQDAEHAKLYHLVSEGQPQMAVSNFFARKLFKDHDVDYTFLLDCDEFLPFRNRMELERFLLGFNSKSEAIYYRWRNLCPEFLDGKKDVFKNRFYLSKRNEKQSTKVILTKAILKDDDWQLVQGNHYVVHNKGNEIISVRDHSIELYHIPIQSYNKFMLKLMSGSLRLRLEKKLLSQGLGAHWDALNSKISRLGIDHDEILSYSMGYPNQGEIDDLVFLDFDFPYIKAPIIETDAVLSSLLQGMMNQVSRIGLDTDNIVLLEETKSDHEKLPYDFDAKKYLSLNPDVLNSVFNPEFHYMRYGFDEGRLYTQ